MTSIIVIIWVATVVRHLAHLPVAYDVENVMVVAKALLGKVAAAPWRTGTALPTTTTTTAAPTLHQICHHTRHIRVGFIRQYQ